MPSATRVLITGASGFVGRWLVPALAARLPSGASILTSDTVGAPGAGGSRFDLTDKAAVEHAVASANPTHLVHLAAVALPREARSAPARAWSVNVLGTVHLADAVRRFAPSARFLYVSSSEVYGAAFRDSDGPVDESTPPRPLTPYAATKAAAELAVRQMVEDGLHAVILRPFNHTGPGQATDYVLPSFAMQIAEIEAGLREPLMQVGNLEARRDFLDVRDVVAAYAAACVAEPLPAGTVINIASGRSHRIGDLLDRLRAMVNRPIAVTVDPGLLRTNEIAVTIGATRAASHWLGWAPTIAIDETLRALLEDCRGRVAAGRSP